MTRIRVYFGIFGAIGTYSMLTTVSQIAAIVTAYQNWFVPFAPPLLTITQLAQAAICLGYIFVAYRYPSLRHSKSALPRRLVQSSIAVAALTTCFRLMLDASLTGAFWLLTLLLNLAYNVSLLRLLKLQDEAESAVEVPSL